MLLSKLWVAAAVFGSAVCGLPVDGALRTLVVGDNSTELQGFVDSLAARGHNVTTVDVHDSSIELSLFDQLTYDHLVLLPVRAKALGSHLTAAKLLEYFNGGGNVLAVTTPKSVPEAVRDFAAELDLHIAPRGYKAIDHFVGGGAAHDTWAVSQVVGPKSVLGDIATFEVAGSGGAYLGNSELVIPLVSGEETTYVYDARDEEEVAKQPWTTGRQVSLAAAVQGNNNARFAWVGSDLSGSNADFTNELSKWVMQEKSVLRASNVYHHRAGEEETHHHYRVSEDIEYSIDVSEWREDRWVPYEASDVQLEFIMLDPYYRLNLEATPKANATTYSAAFKIPDQYGMFTFSTEYRRPGLSFIEERHVVTVRHIANDEWPRSWEITNSWVYLTSAGSVVAAWLVFVLLYLYTGPSTSKVKKTQ
ncbi:dolichyl-diphosphooligosaccharide--protein glycosyltransferase subunit Wbp1p [Trichomonascus vanleenenianus]|uniref:dolichyl-diphosphooligosaccharide-protein glycotransferase n=1 Tax=Trichomonascus vanleenenianus TaxID=2268995 RepID=UPI003ECAB86A